MEEATASKAQPQEQFSPKEPSELPFYGQSHAEVANSKMGDRYKDIPQERKYPVRNGIIKGRMADEAKIYPLMQEVTTPAQKQHVLDLLEEFHHTSSIARAKAARDYYAAKLPKAVADKVRENLNDAYINKSKHEK
jgi:hypothetical protein